jgi:outer membrane protein assembly factor BamB
VAHTPAVAGDLLFIGSCNGTFRALDRRTGQVHWASDVRPQGNTDKYFFHGDPLITNSLIIVGQDGMAGGVYAFDKLTGTIRWKYPAGRGVRSVVVGLGRNAYAVTVDGHLVCLDIDSGHLRWSSPIKVWGFEGPAVANGRVFAGDQDGIIHALDANTGTLLWKKSLGAPISTSVTVHGSDLYLGTSIGGVYRVNPKNGAVLSTLQLDSGPRGKPLLAVDSLLVFLADKEENYHSLVSIDPHLKSVRWRQKAPRTWAASRLLVGRDTVIVGTPAGEVFAFRLGDGLEAWRQTFEGRVRSIGGSGDLLYVGTQEGIVYAYLPPGRGAGK